MVIFYILAFFFNVSLRIEPKLILFILFCAIIFFPLMEPIVVLFYLYNENLSFKKYVNSLMFNLKRIKLNIKNIIMYMLFIALFPLLVKVIVSFKDEIKIIFKYILGVVVIPIIAIFSIKYIYMYIAERRAFKAINKELLSDRNYIASTYVKFYIFLPELISYLENNVKKVSGEFPDKFLQAGKSPSMTKLIQLEAMWREVEEREENQQ